MPGPKRNAKILKKAVKNQIKSKKWGAEDRYIRMGEKSLEQEQARRTLIPSIVSEIIKKVESDDPFKRHRKNGRTVDNWDPTLRISALYNRLTEIFGGEGVLTHRIVTSEQDGQKETDLIGIPVTANTVKILLAACQAGRSNSILKELSGYNSITTTNVDLNNFTRYLREKLGPETLDEFQDIFDENNNQRLVSPDSPIFIIPSIQHSQPAYLVFQLPDTEEVAPLRELVVQLDNLDQRYTQEP